MKLAIPRAVFDALAAHALETFPEECCGVVVDRRGSVEAVRVTNVQNEKHGADPERFPRTATTAYTMGPEAAPVLIDHERGRLRIVAFYHSHPQHDSYFSAEDRKQATVWDEPSYPDAGQIVVSVYDRRVKEAKAFRWNEERRDFAEVELVLT
jgi:proteasome lid subunit RPN8/RPN11